MKYELEGHIRSNKASYVYLFSSNNSSAKPTHPLMLPRIVCALVSLIPTKWEGAVPYLLLDVETQIKIENDIKARFHVVTLLLWRVCVI